MTEDDVYSLIITGDLPRPACLGIIRSYGNRKAMTALEEARKALPESARQIEEAEMDLRLTSCLEKLDEILKVSIETFREETV